MIDTAPRPYKFLHRGTDDRYYWQGPPIPGDSRSELVSIPVDRFWAARVGTEEDYPPCSSFPTCPYRGTWGATGKVPPGHVLVRARNMRKQWLGHDKP